MTDKQAVIDALRRLPEDATLDEIAEELRIMTAVRRGRADVAGRRVKSHEEAISKEIVLQGILSIQAGNNPRVVEMQLLSFLSAKQQAGLAKAA